MEIVVKSCCLRHAANGADVSKLKQMCRCSLAPPTCDGFKYRSQKEDRQDNFSSLSLIVHLLISTITS